MGAADANSAVIPDELVPEADILCCTLVVLKVTKREP
jgi:hypothetical protein